MKTKMTIQVFDDLTLARRATAYAALTDSERREKVHIAAWHCVCIVQARRFVCEVAMIEGPAYQSPNGYGRTYGEKLSEHPASDDTRIDY